MNLSNRVLADPPVMNLNNYLPAQPPAPPKIVIFNMSYRGAAYIAFIKCVRSALDCGLIAARDLVVASKNGGATNIRMTAEQYGKFIAYVLMDPTVSLADVRMSSVNLTTPQPPPKSFDFTAIPAA